MHSLLVLSRAAAQGGATLLDGLGINLVQLLAQIVNFLLVVYFLNGIVIRPILRNLEVRRKRIEDSLENVRLADERLTSVDKDYQAKLSEVSTEVTRLRNEMLAGAQAEAQRIRADALAEANRIKAQAHSAATAERNQMLADSRSQIVDLVLAATHKLVGESLDANQQQALIADFLTTMPAVGWSGVSANGAPVIVTSALPLTADEQSHLKADLAKQVGVVDEIHFKVDPAILGGLVVRVGDKMIDGSVSGRLDDMRKQLEHFPDKSKAR